MTTTFGTEIAILDLLTGYENIIQQLGVYEDVTHVHVVTEMCNGGSLATLLQETRMFKEKEAAWLFRCATTALLGDRNRGGSRLHFHIYTFSQRFTNWHLCGLWSVAVPSL